MKELSPQDRPREKLARVGVEALGDNELVALLVGTGTRGRSALAVAQDLLRLAGGVTGLARMGAEQLTQVTGVGPPLAARLLAAIELGRRVVSGTAEPRRRFENPADVGRYLLPLYGGYHVERFGVVMLDSKQRLIRTAILSIGSLDTSIAHPREIFREAAVASAAAIIVFHNHPSGDPKPSTDDVLLTRRLVQAGEVMGITLADHIILGEGRWFSFRDASRL